MAGPEVNQNDTWILIKWWQEILTGVFIIVGGLLLRANGLKEPVYLTESDISQRLKICKQDIVLEFILKLEERDKELTRTLDARYKKLLDRIKEIMK